MPESASTILPYETPPKPSLARRTASGFVWMTTQSLGLKLLSAASQLALAWLLQPTEFGLIGLAYAVTGFTALIQQAGLREILVQRHNRFRRWSNAAFWMSL
jgi:PST family polysaccharide transporter